MNAEQYAAALEKIIDHESDPTQRRLAMEKLAARYERAKMRAYLESMEEATGRLGEVAVALERHLDSGSKTREEIAGLREEAERLRNEIATLTRVLMRRYGNPDQQETSGETEPFGGRGGGSVPAWVVKALLVLLALSLAGALGVAGVKIASSWLPVSVEPVSSDSGEGSSTP